jgi:hypothetical protein
LFLTTSGVVAASAANFAWRHKAKLVMVWGEGGEFDNEVGAAFSDMFSSPVIDTVATFPAGCDITHRYEAPVDESTLLFQRWAHITITTSKALWWLS